MESSRLRDDDSDFFFINNNKPRISRHNTMSRRFFPSSNFTISSTASSPGHAFKDEIVDPSTYCFSTALKALQARSGYHTWECSSPTSEGLALNSKWDEAEKYICNPLSGKVPVECLSSKSLITAKSFRYHSSSSSSSNRITMSAPLVFSSSSNNNKPFSSSPQDLTLQLPIIPPEKKKKEGRTRDVGTQSTPPYVSSSSSSPSAASTPSIMERSIKRVGDSSSTVSISKTKSEDEDDQVEEEKEKEREETKTKIVTVTTTHDIINDEENKEEQEVCSKRRQQQGGGGCFPWTCMTTRFHIRNNHKLTDKPRKYHNNVFPTTTYSSSSF
ncbi:hypothetical protein QN277_011531 [Acacia crassicarpa]|uniref:Uncharacterized protein n=1 Tax=Acacia crassicarpa TaxID=499986 RepID=A0AAE1TDJ8_9FABA|nr:hypothetical protein QN277_011531 [Acacia crassicarpa]